MRNPRITIDSRANVTASIHTSREIPPRSRASGFGSDSSTPRRSRTAAATLGTASRNRAVRHPKAVTNTATPRGAMKAPTDPPHPWTPMIRPRSLGKARTRMAVAWGW